MATRTKLNARPHSLKTTIVIAAVAPIVGALIGAVLGAATNLTRDEAHVAVATLMPIAMFVVPLGLTLIHLRNPIQRSIPAIILQGTMYNFACLSVLFAIIDNKQTVSQQLHMFALASLAIALIAVVPLHLVLRMLFRTKIDPTPICPKCQYNLTGTRSHSCPECGTAIREMLRSKIESIP